MTRKNKASKENKKNKKIEQLALKERRAWAIKRYILIACQALFGTLIGVCFFIYHINAQIVSDSLGESTESTASFYDISRDYFDSPIYTQNLNDSVAMLLRYVAIREQMEENAEFSPSKKINIGEYAFRNSDMDYDGPIIEYYLDDLIKWGQKAAGNYKLYCSYDFYNAMEYCDFFGLDYEEFKASDKYVDDETVVASFDTLKNQYLSVEGKRLEEYASNVSDYEKIVNCLQETANDIYSNYSEYLTYNEKFTDETTNLKYVVTLTSNNRRTIYTNLSGLNVYVSESKIENIMKGYSEYIYACPGTIEFVTNTPILYETIKDMVIDRYSYSYPDDTKIWISLDTTFPVEDMFYLNKVSFEKTAKLIPWLVSLGAVSLIAFIALIVIILQKEKKLYSYENTKEELGYFDRLPIEVGILFFILLVLVLYMGEYFIIKRMDYSDSSNYILYFVPSCALVIADIFIGLMFVYGIARRIICKNVTEGSIFSIISPFLSKITSKGKRWTARLYDDGNVAIKTWSAYIVFLLFNVFWACMLFFSRKPVIAFLILLVFDICVGVTLFNKNWERKKILDAIKNISMGDYDCKIDSSKMRGSNKELADAINDVGLGLGKAVEISIKDEKLKADLITNVSHDIKTPLTSIINYVDLLKRIDLQDEKARKYIAVLDEKSQRLKQLTFDLVEASKITSGNISIDLNRVNFNEFIKQAVGEFEEKFEEKGLSLVLNLPKTPIYIMADPRHMWRVLENLLNNVCKYALTDTRVYLDVVIDEMEDKQQMVLSLKNISGQQLNIPANELTERFIRGDVSRSTEGSGLGLSIAKSLTIVQKGSFEIYLDGDLFKVTICFDICE